MATTPTFANPTLSNVTIVDSGDEMRILHIPDPAKAKNPRALLEEGDPSDYMVLAYACRYYKSYGDPVSGWLVRGPLVHSCLQPMTKREMRQQMRALIRTYAR